MTERERDYLEKLGDLLITEMKEVRATMILISGNVGSVTEKVEMLEKKLDFGIKEMSERIDLNDARVAEHDKQIKEIQLVAAAKSGAKEARKPIWKFCWRVVEIVFIAAVGFFFGKGGKP